MLDEIDKTILRELDKDVRISLTQLAKKARISKEKAHYRLHRLEENTITGYWGLQRLGHSAAAYKIFLKDKSLGKRKQELIAFLMQNKEAAWIAETEGRWDIVVSSYAATESNFMHFVGELLQRFGTALREKSIIKMTGAISLNEKYLHKEPYVRASEDDFTESPRETDAIDATIINETAKNARITYTDLAKAAGLSAEAVSYRFRKLLKEKAFVDMKVRINHAALDLSYYHVLLSLEQYEARDSILAYYKQHPACVYIMTHLGLYDIHLELVLAAEELQGFLTDLSERFGKSLGAYEVLHIVKEHRMQVQADTHLTHNE